MSRRAPGPSKWEAPQAERQARRARRRAVLVRLCYAAALVIALATVVWRQTVGAERMRELEKVREEVSLARAERDQWGTKVLELQRRERIVRYAREKLQMHVAKDDEIILLPVPAAAVRPDSAAPAGEEDR